MTTKGAFSFVSIPSIVAALILFLLDVKQVVAGHGGEPDVTGLVPQHLVVDVLRLVLPAMALHHVVQLDLDDTHLLINLVILILPVPKNLKLTKKKHKFFFIGDGTYLIFVISEAHLLPDLVLLIILIFLGTGEALLRVHQVH